MSGCSHHRLGSAGIAAGNALVSSRVGMRWRSVAIVAVGDRSRPFSDESVLRLDVLAAARVGVDWEPGPDAGSRQGSRRSVARVGGQSRTCPLDELTMAPVIERASSEARKEMSVAVSTREGDRPRSALEVMISAIFSFGTPIAFPPIS